MWHEKDYNVVEDNNAEAGVFAKLSGVFTHRRACLFNNVHSSKNKSKLAFVWVPSCIVADLEIANQKRLKNDIRESPVLKKNTKKTTK